MSTRSFLNRFIIISFLVLIGYCLAYAINSRSFFGIVLALISLGAGVYFLYLLAQAKEELEKEKSV